MTVWGISVCTSQRLQQNFLCRYRQKAAQEGSSGVPGRLPLKRAAAEGQGRWEASWSVQLPVRAGRTSGRGTASRSRRTVWVQRRERASLKPLVLVHLWFHCQPGRRVRGHPEHPQCNTQPGCRAALWGPALGILLSGKISRIRHCVFFKVHLETCIFGLKKKVFSLPEFQDHSENCE